MSISTKNKSLIITGIALCVVAGGYMGYDYIRTLNVKSIEQVSLWKEDKVRKSELATLEAKIADARANDGILQKMFLTEDTTVNFFDMLETLGDALGATTSISSLQKFNHGTVGTTTIERIAMSIVAEGEWRALYNYMALLETLPYAARLDSVTMALSVKGANLGGKNKITPRWIADISLSVLKYK